MEGPRTAVDVIVSGLRAAGGLDADTCTQEACDVAPPSELENAVKALKLTTPPAALQSLTKALRASGVAPPEAFLRSLATAFLVDELVLRDLEEGLVVQGRIDVAGYEAEQSDYPEGVILQTEWPKQQEEQVFQAVVSLLRKHGVSRWEADAVLLALRGDKEEEIFKTGPDRILRDLRWALRAARVNLSQGLLLRELAEMLRDAGVQPRDPVLHDLDMYIALITETVADPSASPTSKAAADAWLVAIEEAWRFSVSRVEESWRAAAKNIERAAGACVDDECNLVAA
jgi:hypothetical protein